MDDNHVQLYEGRGRDVEAVGGRETLHCRK